MNTSKRNRLIPAVLMVLAAFLVTSCEMKEKDYVEYRGEDFAFYGSDYDYDGDDYIERYLLYEEDGEYERYIGGWYKRVKYDGPHWGTLYETGTYKETADADGETRNITFRPKKRYDTNTQTLRPMAASDIELETRQGEITEKTLTITYFDEDYIWSSFFSSPWFTREYTRK